MELETQLLIARNLGYLADAVPLLDQLAEVARLLNGLLNSMCGRSDNRQPTTDNRQPTTDN